MRVFRCTRVCIMRVCPQRSPLGGTSALPAPAAAPRCGGGRRAASAPPAGSPRPGSGPVSAAAGPPPAGPARPRPASGDRTGPGPVECRVCECYGVFTQRVLLSIVWYSMGGKLSSPTQIATNSRGKMAAQKCRPSLLERAPKRAERNKTSQTRKRHSILAREGKGIGRKNRPNTAENTKITENRSEMDQNTIHWPRKALKCLKEGQGLQPFWPIFGFEIFAQIINWGVYHLGGDS